MLLPDRYLPSFSRPSTIAIGHRSFPIGSGKKQTLARTPFPDWIRSGRILLVRILFGIAHKADIRFWFSYGQGAPQRPVADWKELRVSVFFTDEILFQFF
jgi:hypothetical protein